MDAGIIYANARIKALENNLLTSDKLMRMIDAQNMDEAVKVLTESNYGGGVVPDNSNKFEALLQSESDKVAALIREIMPIGEGLEIFFLKSDYHNAKALMKGKYSGISSDSHMLLKHGYIDLEKLKDAIMTDNYRDLYPEMREALLKIDNAFVSGQRNPSFIDSSLDKAYYLHAERVTVKGAPSIKRYLKIEADLTNISIFFRMRRAGLNVKFFTESFIAGGELALEFFLPLYEGGDEVVREKFRYLSYRSLVEKAVEAGRALTNYETAQDNMLLNIFKSDKNDMFSVAPMAGYYLAKQTEIKVARMVLVCLKNKVDKLLIKQRLRELYA
jgi:V/A-type H+-transporting ATPase subunit C